MAVSRSRLSELIDARGLQLLGAASRANSICDTPMFRSHSHWFSAVTLTRLFCELSIPRLDLQGSWTAEIIGDGACIRQHIYLRGIRAEAATALDHKVDATVSLVQANIQVVFVRTGDDYQPSWLAISGDGIKVGGDVFFRAGS